MKEKMPMKAPMKDMPSKKEMQKKMKEKHDPMMTGYHKEKMPK